MDFIIATGILEDKTEFDEILQDTQEYSVPVQYFDFVDESSMQNFLEDVAPFQFYDFFKTSDREVESFISAIEKEAVPTYPWESMAEIPTITISDLVTEYPDELEDFSFFNYYFGTKRSGISIRTTIVNRLRVNTSVQSLPARLQITTELIRATLDSPIEETPVLNLVVNPEGSGIAQLNYLYDQGRSASVYAYTDEVDYEFSHWSDSTGVLSYDDAYQLCIPELNYFLTANFVFIGSATISLTTNRPSDTAVTGGGTFSAGDIATIEAESLGEVINFDDGVIPGDFNLDGDNILPFLQSEDTHSGGYALKFAPLTYDIADMDFTYTSDKESIFSCWYKVQSAADPEDIWGEIWIYPIDSYNFDIDFYDYLHTTNGWKYYETHVPPGEAGVHIEWGNWAEDSNYLLVDDIQIRRPANDAQFGGWVTGGVTISTTAIHDFEVGTEDTTIEAVFSDPVVLTMSTVELTTNKPGYNFMWGSGRYAAGDTVEVETAFINEPINFANGKLPALGNGLKWSMYSPGDAKIQLSDEVYLTGGYSLSVNNPDMPVYEGFDNYKVELRIIATVASLVTVNIVNKATGDITDHIFRRRVGSSSTQTVTPSTLNWATDSSTIPTYSGSFEVKFLHYRPGYAEIPIGKWYIDSIQFQCAIPEPTFLGWHDGTTTVSTSPIYTFTMPTHNVTLEAIYS